jgi:hypothetical protein
MDDITTIITRLRVQQNILNKRLRQRTINMLSGNKDGWNIIRNSDKLYKTIGRYRTFITDKRPFERALGKRTVNAIIRGRRGYERTRLARVKETMSRFPGFSRIARHRAIKRRLLDIKIRSGNLTISERKARQLQKNLGLTKRFEASNTISLIRGINQRQSRVPSEGNKYFRGKNKGLPKNDPELTVKAIRSDGKKVIQNKDKTTNLVKDKNIRQFRLRVRQTRLDRIKEKLTTDSRVRRLRDRSRRKENPTSRYGKPGELKGNKNHKAPKEPRSFKTNSQNKAAKTDNAKVNTSSKEKLKSRYGRSKDVSHSQPAKAPRESKVSSRPRIDGSSGRRRR